MLIVAYTCIMIYIHNFIVYTSYIFITYTCRNVGCLCILYASTSSYGVAMINILF